jgi:uncharacterized protein involved in tellurium resistance
LLDLDAPPAPAPVATPAPRPPTPSAPSASSSLDLDAPAPPPPAAPSPPVSAPVTPTAASAGSSLDLDAPTPTGAAIPPAPAASSSLDLSPPAASAPSAPVVAPTPPPRRTPDIARAPTGQQTILTDAEPTVTLTRLQSGIGSLVIDAACTAQVGDLRLGCAYQLTSGASSTVQLAGGIRFGPSDAKQPVIVATHEQYERITLDLRQCREIERLAIYAFSESRAALNWGGTLITTTQGGARIEVALELPATAAVAMLLTVYQVRGELVLRREMEHLDGSIRDACRAYGFDRITWLDDRTPVR